MYLIASGTVVLTISILTGIFKLIAICLKVGILPQWIVHSFVVSVVLLVIGVSCLSNWGKQKKDDDYEI